MKYTSLLTGAIILNLAIAPFAHAADPKFNQERFTEQIGSEMDIPESGLVSHQNVTYQRSNPAKGQGADQNAQVTIKGGEGFVSGNDTKSVASCVLAHFRVQRDADEWKLGLNTRHYQLFPDTTERDALNRSPDRETLLKKMESAGMPADLRARQSGTINSVSKKNQAPDLSANKYCHVVRELVL